MERHYLESQYCDSIVLHWSSVGVPGVAVHYA
jgi:hypothetical protein